jgi:competence protein ComEA
MTEDPVDEVVRRRFVRVVGLPDVATEASPDASALAAEYSAEPEAGRPPDQARAAQALRAFDPGRRGVRALAAVAVVVVAIAGLLAWRSRPQVTPLAVRVETTPTASGSIAASTGALVVAVAGRVQRPGLVRLPAGSRVADAIGAAGGPLAYTDLSYINLARKVADGELLLIGVTPPPAAAGGGADGGGSNGVGSGAAGGQLNLNTATLTDLQTLPGVGPVLAQRIIDHRAKQGQFRSVDDLRQVDGIGDARFKQLKDLVTV